MNRNIAALVALALFLAHILTVGDDWMGGLTPPVDRAHVSYALARHMVFQGSLTLPGSEVGLEAYPSFLWVLVTLIPERLYLSVNTFCQGLGVLAALSTLALTVRSQRRGAEMVIPMLIAVNGGIAAAALNGMETTLTMLLLFVAFRAYERRMPRVFMLVAVPLLLLHALAWFFVGGLLAISILSRGERKDRVSARRFTRFPVLALVLAGGILLVFAGQVPGPRVLAWLHIDGQRIGTGLRYVGDFVRQCPAALLVIFPVAFAILGKLDGAGRRALFLSFLWFAVVVYEGGDELALYEMLVPILPILFVSIQQGLIAGFDRGGSVRVICMVMFGATTLFTTMASKAPSSIGPFDFSRARAAWLGTPDSSLATRELGRPAQVEEIQRCERLRSIALALRDAHKSMSAETSILSPWPGALTYLSELRVIDPHDRTVGPRPRPWVGPRGGDLLRALEQEPTFILYTLDFGEDLPTHEEVAKRLIEDCDALAANGLEPSSKHWVAVLGHLKDYEFSNLPVHVHFRGPRPNRPQILTLLRRSAVRLGPEISATIVRDQNVRVEVYHRGHMQLVRLRVQVEDETGALFSLRPDGGLTVSPAVYARAGFLLYDSGERAVRLLEMQLPTLGDGELPVAVRVQLFHPGRHDASPRFAAGPEQRLGIR